MTTNSKEAKKAEDKKYENEGEKTPAASTPAFFPLFPLGTFFLPLFIPCPPQAEKNDR